MSQCSIYFVFVYLILVLCSCQSDSPRALEAPHARVPKKKAVALLEQSSEPSPSPHASLVLRLEQEFDLENVPPIQDTELKSIVTQELFSNSSQEEEGNVSLRSDKDEKDLLDRLQVGMSNTGKPIFGFKLAEKSEQAKKADMRNADPDAVGVRGQIDDGKIISDP